MMPRRSRDSQAADLMDTFTNYSYYKTSSWAQIFRQCDRYYAGFHDGRTWPGSSLERSDMKLHVTSDLIETLFSSITHTLFYSGGENFFDVVGGKPPDARNITDRLRFILHAPFDISGRTSFWDLRRSLRYILQYSVGFCGVTYDDDASRPVLENVSPYDFYWSPQTSDWIDESPYLFKFGQMTMAELMDLRNEPGYRIPSDKQLKELKNNQSTQDPTWNEKQEGALQKTGYNVDQLPDGTDAPYFDIIRATTRERIYWLMPMTRGQGASIIFEGRNRLGHQPYVAAVYRPLLHKFGGIAPVSLLSAEHALQQRIVNLMLDLAELRATPPMRSGSGTVKQKPYGPGLTIPSNKDKVDEPMDLPDWPTELGGLYGESVGRMHNIAGTNRMAVSGRAEPSNINRTQGGVQLQEAAREERQFGPLLEIESMLIVPTLLKLIHSDRINSADQSQVQGLDQDNRVSAIDPKVMEAQMHLEVRGATRMVGFARLSGQMRVLLQYYTSAEIQEMAAKQGWTLDFDELNQLVHDGTGTDRKYKIYRPMTEEEQQQYQQQEQQAQQLQLQGQREQAQIMAKAQTDKASTDAQAKQAIAALQQEGMAEDRATTIIGELMKALQPAPKPAETKGAKAA